MTTPDELEMLSTHYLVGGGYPCPCCRGIGADPPLDQITRVEAWAIPARSSLRPVWDAVAVDPDHNCRAWTECRDHRRRRTIVCCAWGRPHGEAPHWPWLFKAGKPATKPPEMPEGTGWFIVGMSRWP